MVFSFIITITATDLVLCSLASTVFAAGSLYRYTNDQGTKVITDVISPQNAAKGYNIIDSRGNVIETVPPELSQAEKERLKNDLAEKESLEKWDKELMARYSNVEDIIAAKERRMSGIKNSVSSLELTLQNIAQTIKHYQAEAAANERQGEKVTPETLSSIERLQNDKECIEQEIKRQKKRRDNTNESYDADIERFRLISSKK